LALKRHEVPPPGYFEDFSGHVIARIRAGERAGRGTFWENLSWEAPWLRQLWSAFETKPIFAGALGMAVCGILVSGVVYSQKADNSDVATNDTKSDIQFVAQRFPASDTYSLLGIAPQPAAFATFDGAGLSATPVSFPLTPTN
jgi:hypothetical protein